MGLCKCPKRKVTNQFCFEHRVNVCEHCTVKKHPNCVVQSYLQWLQDSDYDPNCALCSQDLSEEGCVRLACYHVFHWVCLDGHLGNLPPDTAPAGYACPTCEECVFPPDNLVSPVADALRDLLSGVNWARAGLGLPLLEGTAEKRPTFSSAPPPSGPRPNPEGDSGAQISDGLPKTAADLQTVIQFDTPTSRTSSGKVVMATSPLLLEQRDKEEEDKYRRRSAVRFVSRWWRTMVAPKLSRAKRLTKVQKVLLRLALALIAFVSLMVIVSHLSKHSSSGYDGNDYGMMDPMLDPRNNPNIRVEKT